MLALLSLNWISPLSTTPPPQVITVQVMSGTEVLYSVNITGVSLNYKVSDVSATGT
jgi:hypothetical protein